MAIFMSTWISASGLVASLPRCLFQISKRVETYQSSIFDTLRGHVMRLLFEIDTSVTMRRLIVYFNDVSGDVTPWRIITSHEFEV